MHSVKIVRLLPALLCTLLLAAPSSAQADPNGVTQSASSSAPNQPPLLSSSQLVTYFFTPRFVRLDEVYDVGRRLYGRSYFVIERGGYASKPVDNLQVLGDSLLIYDTEQAAQTIGEALHALDRQSQPAEGDVPAKLKTVAWSPKSISLRSAWAAVSSRVAESVHSDTDGSFRTTNLALVQELSSIVICDTPQRVDDLVETLDALDRPEPQLLLTFRVLVGRDEGAPADPRVPAELVADLATLVPYAHFEQAAFGVARCSARSDEIQLRLDEDYTFELRPSAYDETTGRMTVDFKFEGSGQGMRTRTTLAADEDTVLGAAGAEPVFAVVRVQRLDGARTAAPEAHRAR
ncbi:MAG: hypothetical protein H6825_13000 [Planctomycetes bacterium]|nr:hypothetical protein [Planctomycetota bacterium]